LSPFAVLAPKDQENENDGSGSQDIPKTGDESNVVLYIVSIIFAMYDD